MPSYIYISIKLKRELLTFASADGAKVVSILNVFANASTVKKVSAFNSKYGLGSLSLHHCSYSTYRWSYLQSNVDTLLTLVVLAIMLSTEITFPHLKMQMEGYPFSIW